jgi:hypothetical protein
MNLKFVPGPHTRNGRGILNGLAVILIIASFLCGGPVSAQSSDEAWYRRAINSLGKAMYFCAWPTDTYDHMEFGTIDLKPGGADVSVILYGTSWLEGDLWTEAVAEFRNGQMTNLRFGRYSRKALIPPGTVMKEGLKAVNEELKRQQSQQTPQAPIAVLCLRNPTPDPIAYSLPSEQVSPQTLGPGQTWMFWHGGGGDFTVSFGATKAAGLQKTIRLKGIAQASKPSSCEAGMTYDFVASDQRVGLQPRTWIAGAESPFTPNLIQSPNVGKWVCAEGYKWASQDERDTTCIPDSTGLIGVDLKLEDNDGFPTIVSVRPGTSASRADVPAGSLLVEVNGESVRGLSIDSVVARTRGTVNTYVRIGVLPRGSDRIQYFNLRRE